MATKGLHKEKLDNSVFRIRAGWIRIQSSQWIWIQGSQNSPKEGKNFMSEELTVGLKAPMEPKRPLSKKPWLGPGSGLDPDSATV
jgi:hypothetical protein